MQAMLGILPFLITYHLIKNQLVCDLDLAPLNLGPSDHNLAPHLVICHVSFTIWNLAKNPKKQKISIQNAATESTPKSSYPFLWGEPHSLHSGMTGSHLPYNSNRLDGNTCRKTGQMDLALYFCYITYSYLTSLSLELPSVKSNDASSQGDCEDYMMPGIHR